jgi:putative SOS response-associated peptidase YedK
VLAHEMGSDDKERLLFWFLTTDANDVVRPVHAKAMPVILTGKECDDWLKADVEAALKLQRPLPAERLAIVAKGEREDGTPAMSLRMRATVVGVDLQRE